MARPGLAMSNECVTPSRAPRAPRRVDTGHLTCPKCQASQALWHRYAQATQWKLGHKPVEELGGNDPELGAELDGPGHAEAASGGSEFISHEERVLQLAEAERVGILMPHEAAVLTALFTIFHEGQRLSWRAVASRAACSRKRAQRTMLPALHRWHTQCGPNDRLAVESQTVRVQIRGLRHREVWTRHTFRLGSRRFSWSERVTDIKKQRIALRSRDKQTERKYRAVPTTTMRSLGTALVFHLSGLKIPKDIETQRLKNSPDWEHNVQWAERKLGRARTRTKRLIVGVADILRVLGQSRRLCHACHTPILAGCRIDGRAVTSGREFCCDACKMQVQRKRSQKSG